MLLLLQGALDECLISARDLTRSGLLQQFGALAGGRR